MGCVNSTDQDTFNEELTDAGVDPELEEMENELEGEYDEEDGEEPFDIFEDDTPGGDTPVDPNQITFKSEYSKSSIGAEALVTSEIEMQEMEKEGVQNGATDQDASTGSDEVDQEDTKENNLVADADEDDGEEEEEKNSNSSSSVVRFADEPEQLEPQSADEKADSTTRPSSVDEEKDEIAVENFEEEETPTPKAIETTGFTKSAATTAQNESTPLSVLPIDEETFPNGKTTSS